MQALQSPPLFVSHSCHSYFWIYIECGWCLCWTFRTQKGTKWQLSKSSRERDGELLDCVMEGIVRPNLLILFLACLYGLIAALQCHGFHMAQRGVQQHLCCGQFISDMLKIGLRREAEASDGIVEFFMWHNVGGGAGSGVGCSILEAIRCDYPRNYVGAASMVPIFAGKI